MPKGRHSLRRLTTDAMLLGAALILAYLESFIPLEAFIPLPGIKLGFANIAVVAAAYRCGIGDSGAVSAARIIISSILFGSAASFVFSAAGGIAAFGALTLCVLLFRRYISPVGASVLCAAAHNAGQICAAAIVFGSAAPFYYLPVLLAASLFTGTVTGILLCTLFKALEKYDEKSLIDI